MSIQNRVYIMSAVKENIENFMRENNVSAKDMEDALNSILVNLKNQIFYDFLLEQQQMQQDEAVIENDLNEGVVNE